MTSPLAAFGLTASALSAAQALVTATGSTYGAAPRLPIRRLHERASARFTVGTAPRLAACSKRRRFGHKLLAWKWPARP